MIHEPEIIFLDESTGGVDPETRRRFWEMIYDASENGTTVFVTTHYMDEAEYCDRVSVMVDGKIAALGSPEKLKDAYRAENMDEVFRIIVGRLDNPDDIEDIFRKNMADAAVCHPDHVQPCHEVFL